jgi:hydrogenase nickel incorporation protein HypA/HybF
MYHGPGRRPLPVHELQVTQDILDTVRDFAGRNDVRKVLKIRLLIGELCDFHQEWVPRYFDRLSAASVAEGAEITIETVPAAFRCDDCRTEFEVEVRLTDSVRCPGCGGAGFSLLRGRELLIQDMQVE